MAGLDVMLAARMAGTSVAMIERVYGHFRNQSYQEAQARLDRVRGARGRPRNSVRDPPSLCEIHLHQIFTCAPWDARSGYRIMAAKKRSPGSTPPTQRPGVIKVS